MAARLDCPYCSGPAMTVIRKVFVLLLPKRCESCGEKVTAPRVAELLFAPIAILLFLEQLSTRNNGPGFSEFGGVVVLVLLAAAYFIYIVWVPLTPKEDAFDRGEQLWWLTQQFLILIGSGLIALPIWFLLTFDFRASSSATQPAQEPGHTNVVTALAWSPDGKTLASGSADTTIKLWEPGGRLLQTLNNTDPVKSVAWSPDGKTLAAVGDDSHSHPIKLWDPSSGKLLRDMDDTSVDSVAWNPDGRILATGGYDDTVKLWDASNGNLLRTLHGHSNTVVSLAWSPDGRLLASISSEGITRQDGIRLWDTTNGRLLRTLRVHDRLGGGDLAWSPDGKILASAWAGVRLWDASTGRLLHKHRYDGILVNWSPDSKMLAGEGDDNTVKLWNADNGQLVRTLSGHSRPVWSLTWSPDGKTLASGSYDHTIKLWGVSDGRLLSTLGHAMPDRTVVCPPENAMECLSDAMGQEKAAQRLR